MPQKRYLIRIGKSGGLTLRKAIKASDLVFDDLIHVVQPPIDLTARYIISTRAPISRALSAFNWRHHLVVDTDTQPDRFPGERQILQHYQTLNRLAEALYFEDGSDNALAQGNFRSIHHLGEGIAFYLEALLAAVGKEGIAGVISQESLREDSLEILGVEIEERAHAHGSKTSPEMLVLSGQAHRNLVRFLKADFDCMEVLDGWGMLSAQASSALAKEKSKVQ